MLHYVQYTLENTDYFSYITRFKKRSVLQNITDRITIMLRKVTT